MQNPNTTLPKVKIRGIYTAFISQTGTSAPNVIELHNTFNENIYWTYLATGYYVANSDLGVFTTDRTIGYVYNVGLDNTTAAKGEELNTNQFVIRTASGGVAANDVLQNGTVVQIITYSQPI